MAATVQALAELVQGRVHGDGGQLITDARSLDEARAGHVTFIDGEKNARHLERCRASAVVVPASLPVNGRTLIQVTDPLGAFLTIFQHLRPPEPAPAPGIDPRAVVDPTAVLGEGVSVQAFACVGAGTVLGARCRLYPSVVVGRGCRLGDDVTLYPHVVLYDGCVLGRRVIVHAHAVLGADGFGYRLQEGRHAKVPQLGHVEVGDDVEIGAGACIDRGTFQATRIGPGTKIDNLVQVGHNCQIGPHNIFVSQVGIGGSSTTGAYVVMAGQAGVADHITVGDGALVGAKSGIIGDVPAGARFLGCYAQAERDEKRCLALIRKLPQMREDLQRVLRHLKLDE